MADIQNHVSQKNLVFCHFCKTIVEDEIHFIYDCPIYEDLRKKYYSIHICNSSDNVLKENHCKVFCNPVNAVHSRIYMNVLNCVLKIECNNTNLLSNSTLFAKCFYIHFNYKL